MNASLLNLVRRYADAHHDSQGAAVTPVPGLMAMRALYPDELQSAVNRPLVAMLLQGRKRVTVGADSHEFGPGESLLIAADLPTISQITTASPAAPYYSLVLELDPVILRSLTVEIANLPADAAPSLQIVQTDAQVADAALRLMQLLDQPAALPVLGAAYLREMHYWLLVGRHGGAIRSLAMPDSHANRIARAIAMIRQDISQSLKVEDLATVAGMSASSFHQHFRSVTTLSPLQFQKQLRLIEARRLMLAEGKTIGAAAWAVGYESVPQFTREYGRMFGTPPARDMRQARLSA